MYLTGIGFLGFNIWAMIASALFIDGKLDRCTATRWDKTVGFQIAGRRDSSIAERFDFRPVWAKKGIFRASK